MTVERNESDVSAGGSAVSIHLLKPRFQALLRPLVRRLHAAGVTANQVSVAACAVSVALGPSLTWTLAAGERRIRPFTFWQAGLIALVICLMRRVRTRHRPRARLQVGQQTGPEQHESRRGCGGSRSTAWARRSARCLSRGPARR